MYFSTIVQLLLITTVTAAPLANRANALLRARDAAPLAILDGDLNQALEVIERPVEWVEETLEEVLSSREAAPFDIPIHIDLGLDLSDVDTSFKKLAREAAPVTIGEGPGELSISLVPVGTSDVKSIIHNLPAVGG
jgi:hypothetical protein